MKPAANYLDYGTLEALRLNHPSWRFLRADQAPLAASFLHRVFIVPNLRFMAQSDLAEALEDQLFGLRNKLGERAFPKSAADYLNDWAANDKGWLRKFYIPESDEPHFDLTPPTEKAIAWLGSLTERAFVGTESRLLTLFDLLKQMADGSELDPQVRIAELTKRRDEIDTEIARAKAGEMSLLDDTAIRDRFQQVASLARELLSDFREVEHNFRGLDRKARERIARREGGKGSLLEEIMGERDEISDSDQGRSFKAFWDFLMSSRKQDELTHLLDLVLALPAVASTNPDVRLRRIHYDWLEAGDHTQRTVAQLSQQLRRFLDDTAWLENRRIMDILHGIEAKTLDLRDSLPMGEFCSVSMPEADLELPMERPLYKPPSKARITKFAIEAGDSDVDPSALFSRTVVDSNLLKKHIRQSLQDSSQITLKELLEKRPLHHGLAELVVYLQLATDTFETVIDETATDIVVWVGQDSQVRQARLPRVIFVR